MGNVRKEMKSDDCLKILDELYQTLKPPYNEALHYAILCLELLAAACYDEDLIPKLDRDAREEMAHHRRGKFRVYNGGEHHDH